MTYEELLSLIGEIKVHSFSSNTDSELLSYMKIYSSILKLAQDSIKKENDELSIMCHHKLNIICRTFVRRYNCENDLERKCFILDSLYSYYLSFNETEIHKMKFYHEIHTLFENFMKYDGKAYKNTQYHILKLIALIYKDSTNSLEYLYFRKELNIWQSLLKETARWNDISLKEALQRTHIFILNRIINHDISYDGTINELVNYYCLPRKTLEYVLLYNVMRDAENININITKFLNAFIYLLPKTLEAKSLEIDIYSRQIRSQIQGLTHQ